MSNKGGIASVKSVWDRPRIVEKSATNGSEVVLEVRNRDWTHVRIEGQDFLLTESQAAVVRTMAGLVSADEFVVRATEVVRMAEQFDRKLSQIFRDGSPIPGKVFRYLRQPRGYVEIMLSGVVSSI